MIVRQRGLMRVPPSLIPRLLSRPASGIVPTIQPVTVLP